MLLSSRLPTWRTSPPEVSPLRSVLLSAVLVASLIATTFLGCSCDCLAIVYLLRSSPHGNAAALFAEVFDYAARGVAPSSLIADAASTPTTSPTTPLLLGLGPASGTRASSGSIASPAAPPGLHPPSGGWPASIARPLPLPLVSRTGNGQPPAVAPAPPTGYGRLPDNLYGSDSPRSTGSGSSGLASTGSGLNVAARPFSFGGASSRPSLASDGSRTSSPAPTPAAASNLLLRPSSLAPSAPAFSPQAPSYFSMHSTRSMHSTQSSPALPRGGMGGESSTSSRATSQSSGSTHVSPSMPAFSSLGSQQYQGPPLLPPALLPPSLAPKAPLQSPTAVAPFPTAAAAGPAAAAASSSAVGPPGLDDDDADGALTVLPVGWQGLGFTWLAA